MILAQTKHIHNYLPLLKSLTKALPSPDTLLALRQHPTPSYHLPFLYNLSQNPNVPPNVKNPSKIIPHQFPSKTRPAPYFL